TPSPSARRLPRPRMARSFKESKAWVAAEKTARAKAAERDGRAKARAKALDLLLTCSDGFSITSRRGESARSVNRRGSREFVIGMWIPAAKAILDCGITVESVARLRAPTGPGTDTLELFTEIVRDPSKKNAVLVAEDLADLREILGATNEQHLILGA